MNKSSFCLIHYYLPKADVFKSGHPQKTEKIEDWEKRSIPTWTNPVKFVRRDKKIKDGKKYLLFLNKPIVDIFKPFGLHSY